MYCPLCTDSVLDVTHHDGIEVDICPKCGGVWLDRGELERLVGNSESDAVDRHEAADEREAGAESKGKGKKSKKKSRKQRLADRLGDVLEEVLDI